MVPDSRGSAAVFALLAATVLLAGSLWLLLGVGDPLSEKAGNDRESASANADGARDLALVSEATVLSNEINERKGTLAAPVGLRFRGGEGGETPPPETPHPVPTGTVEVFGAFEGSRVTLRWEHAENGVASWLVARIGEGGDVLSEARLEPAAREYRCEPVTAVKGTARYRVQALGSDGSVAAAGASDVPFYVKAEVSYLGLAPEGRARFRVTWSRDERELEELFLAAPGEQIGAVVAAKDGLPELDWWTGVRFVEIRFRRESAERKTSVPLFGPDGRLDRDPETGSAVHTDRTMPVVLLTEGAVVNSPGPEGRQVWLPKAKD